MQFEILDTFATYERMLDTSDLEQRAAIFQQEIVKPFAPLASIFGGPDHTATLAQWGISADMFDVQHQHETRAKLALLKEANAWERAAIALERGKAAFQSFGTQIPLERVVFGLLLSNAAMLFGEGLIGYTGFGGIPGWIMTVYGQPTPENLRAVEACTVHELHHNILNSLTPENPMITSVGRYIVGEGLAESFAAELYGESTILPYVTQFDEGTLLEPTRRIFGAALNVSGFDMVRNYIFGSAFSPATHTDADGSQHQIPAFAGYAIGYRVVQAYLKRTGKSAVEATFIPAEQILAQSGFFHLQS